jgi:hypothetical protein
MIDSENYDHSQQSTNDPKVFILNKILTNVDEIQSKIPENTYLTLCNDLKELYDNINTQSPSFSPDQNFLTISLYENIINDYIIEVDMLHSMLSRCQRQINSLSRRRNTRNNNTNLPSPSSPPTNNITSQTRPTKICELCNAKLSLKTSLSKHQNTQKCRRLRTHT